MTMDTDRDIAKAHALLDEAEVSPGSRSARVAKIIARSDANFRLYALTEKYQNEEMARSATLLAACKFTLAICEDRQLGTYDDIMGIMRATIRAAEGE
jgi:hypothetical protein